MSEIDLQPFCSRNDWRPYIERPFSFGEYSFATNGHILVRVPRRADAPDGEKPMTPEGLEKVLAYHKDAEFSRLPKFDFPKAPSNEDCESCNGRGVNHDCPSCECECAVCHGTGKAEPKTSISVFGVYFDAKYIRQISALPDIEVSKSQGGDLPMPFRFDGGIGAVMPIRGPDSNHLGDIGS